MRVFPLVLVATLLMPAAAVAQDRQRVPPEADRSGGGSSNGGGANQAVPRESPPPPAPAAPRPAPAAPRAEAPAAAPAPSSSAPSNAGPRTSSAPDSGAGQAQRRQRVPPEARRDGADGGAAGRTPQAIPRPPNQPPRVNGGDDWDRNGYYSGSRVYNNYYAYPYYYYPRRYYPYGYGAFGLGYFYYDPYSWYPHDNYNYRFRGYGYGYPTGELRLQVRPRNAEVFVDGYFAGYVDDFDGIVQALRLEEGPYSIELVAPGYEPIIFNVRIQPGRKITYRGDLRPLRP
jgi:hypothetical protein